MIFLMTAKDWYKNKKKLVVPKDYLIVDGTEDDDAKLSAFTNVITMDGFNPPPKLVKLASKEADIEDIIDYDSLEKLESNFFNGMKLSNAMMAVVAGQVENDINIFVIFRNKAFKRYKKRIKKTFEELFPTDFDFVYIFSGDVKDHKKELREEIDYDQKTCLENLLKKNEKAAKKKYKKYSKKKYKKK